MKFTLKKLPFIRTLALTSLLLPLLHLTQPSAYAAQDVDSMPLSPMPASAAKQRLMEKLAQLSHFSADFRQQILNEQGEVLQQGAGSLAISKPNLVHWQTTTPDETLIVSDGNTLWFYDPFIEQASAYSLANAINNTPILLLTSDDPQLWQQYLVSEVKASTANPTEVRQHFIVIPIDKNSQIKRLTISFATDASDLNHNVSQLSEFSFQDISKQVSKISLNNFNHQDKPAAALFTFTLPEGVRLEDNR